MDERSKTQFTLALPISGGKLVTQIAAGILLGRIGYKPDIVLGSSGGCITYELFLAADIDSVKCERTRQQFEERLGTYLKKFKTEHYCVRRSPIAPINTLMGIPYASTFAIGYGPTFINPDEVDLARQPELWIGTTRHRDNTPQLFCSKSYHTAKLKMNDAIYLNHDMRRVLLAGQASASLPTIVPPTIIDGVAYRDGGLSRASPLGPFIQHHLERKVSYHVIYISPARYSKSDDPHEAELEDDDIWNCVRMHSHGLINGWHVPDRNNGIRVVIDNAEKEGCRYKKVVGKGADFLRRCVEQQRTARCSFIEIAPLQHNMVQFLSMQEGDLFKSVCKSLENGFSIRHWYF